MPHRRRPRRPTLRERLAGAFPWRAAAFALSGVVFAVCAFKLVSYAGDYVRSVRLSRQLRETYLAEEGAEVSRLDLDGLTFADAATPEPPGLASMNTPAPLDPFVMQAAPDAQSALDIQVAQAAPVAQVAPAAQAASLNAPNAAPDQPAQAAQTTPVPQTTSVPQTTPAPQIAVASQTDAIPQATLAPQTTLVPPDPYATMAPITYPHNAFRIVSERFTKLRRQNEDIVGWLTLPDDMLSEAVVQRDNSYYLRRDYQGYHNVNGAIFLEEHVDLSTRPYTLTLYGHNMKTGTMFACLRNYENLSFYHHNPFITFDTIYEKGRYVIFSAAEVSIDPLDDDFSGFFLLDSATAAERLHIIKRLAELSKNTCVVDVNADDQLLLLVTCVGDDEDRRIVAARRVRDGEYEDDLYRKIQTAAKR